MVLLGERPRDAESAGDALVDQRLRERLAGGAALRLVDLLGRQESALADHVRDEVPVSAPALAARLLRLFGLVAGHEPQVPLVLEIHRRLH